jgi:uncharacterized membrane protein YphA (DoxX/SURF4 family)
MDTVLWIVQVVLALGLAAAGLNHITRRERATTGRMAWIRAVPGPLMTTIGVLEILGAIGLILPALTRIAPVLTPIAATAVVALMILAVAFHIRRNELSSTVGNVILGIVAAFVAYGRFVIAPIG